eukprot:scaffold92599_cov30-Tisochrysis_lutea.AAC.1
MGGTAQAHVSLIEQCIRYHWRAHLPHDEGEKAWSDRPFDAVSYVWRGVKGVWTLEEDGGRGKVDLGFEGTGVVPRSVEGMRERRGAASAEARMR